ncbi:MAG: hypothetical protein QTN59_19780 [Candidatus Electrothrix communis]|nr:MAG: hypothetical protein QTN59_19780 [Candidatus Electrothrix communis]
MKFHFMWLLFCFFVVVPPVASIAQEQDDFAQVAEKMAPDISGKARAKMGNQPFRIAVFPFGDSDGNVTISMHEPNTILQGELIVNLMKHAKGKYLVLDKAGLKKEFRAAGIDPSGIASNDPKNTAEIIKKIGVDVAIVGSIDAKSAVQVQKDGLKKINVAVTIIYKDGSADQIAGTGSPSDIQPPTTIKSRRFGVQLFLTGRGAEEEISLITSKNPDSEYHNVFFAEIPDNLAFGTDAASYKIRISNSGRPEVKFYNEKDMERIFGVAVTIDGVNSLYQDQGNGSTGPVVVHPRNARKWIISGPGQKLVPDSSRPTRYRLEAVSDVKYSHSVIDILGFQRDSRTAEKFIFANPRESIAETVGITNDIGVITVHFYPEDMKNDTTTSQTREMPVRLDLGTKPGKPVNNPVVAVNPKLKPNPVEVWRIFYRKKGDCPVKQEDRFPVTP